MRYKIVLLIVGGASLAVALTFGADPASVGEIVRASDAPLNGVAIPEGGMVTPGSVLATGEHGSALIQFSPDSQFNLLEKTSVTFRSEAGRLTAQMSAGTLGVRSLGSEPVVVETPGYQIEPTASGRALYVVAMLSDSTTIVSARRNSVSIVQKSSSQRYVLSEGHYAKIADDPQAAPPQTAQDQRGAPPAPLLLGPGPAFIIAVGAGVGIAVILDKTVLAPSAASPSSP
jgi:hypothetical protein